MLLCDTSIRKLCIVCDGKPLLYPFSEGKQEGIISFGLSHAGYDLRLGNKLLIFKNSYNRTINPKRMKDEKYLSEIFDTVYPESNEFGDYFVMPPHSYA